MADYDPTNDPFAAAGNGAPAYDPTNDPFADRSLGEALQTGAHNLGKSFVSNVKGAGEALMDPVGTVENLGRVGIGEFQDSGQNADMAHAVNQFYKQRYGSWQGFKNAVAQDPFGVIMDLGTVVDPAAGGLAKAGIIGDRAAMMARAATNPLYATGKLASGAAEMAAPKAGNIAASGAGILSGVGAEPYKQMFQANLAGGNKMDLANEAMKGDSITTPEDLVNSARDAIKDIRQDASDQFRADKSTIKDTPMPNAVASIGKSMSDMYKQVGPQKYGTITNPGAYEAFQDINKEYTEWGQRLAQSGGQPSVLSLDELKQRVYNTIAYNDKYKGNDNALRVAKSLANDIRNTIKSPEYDDMESAWEQSRKQLDELERTLSLGPNATVDTASRKLFSSLRDQVNTSFAHRQNLMELLEQKSPGLMGRLAGATLKSIEPRGVSRLGPVGGMLGALYSGTVGGAGLGALVGAGTEFAASSPKVGGTVAKYLGKTGRTVGPGVGKIWRGSFGSPYTTRAAGVAQQPLAAASPFERNDQ